ncbi:hypothetical protein LOD99_4108 [Oopsacas minuta]|uniref:Uncharacterized protein n=1 Tax=Oopsacas minuta TaxID=111878 RepID=A0AAV7JV96_9METZ|nr:hypothetical protein LOD99_4108 [Oopsacas minuta]
MAEVTEKPPGIRITIRLIRSFEYRSIKNIVIKSIPITSTVGELLKDIGKEIHKSSTLPPPFKKTNYDTIKIFTFAHGQKPNSTAINLEDDDKFILSNLDNSLEEVNLENEVELSYFNRADYDKFKLNPVEQQWN